MSVSPAHEYRFKSDFAEPKLSINICEQRHCRGNIQETNHKDDNDESCSAHNPGRMAQILTHFDPEC